MMFGSPFTEEQAKAHLETMKRHISMMSADDQIKINSAIATLQGMAKIDPVCMAVAFTYVAGETMMDLMTGKYRK